MSRCPLKKNILKWMANHVRLSADYCKDENDFSDDKKSLSERIADFKERGTVWIKLRFKF